MELVGASSVSSASLEEVDDDVDEEVDEEQEEELRDTMDVGLGGWLLSALC